jgi:hypothetical protein
MAASDTETDSGEEAESERQTSAWNELQSKLSAIEERKNDLSDRLETDISQDILRGRPSVFEESLLKEGMLQAISTQLDGFQGKQATLSNDIGILGDTLGDVYTMMAERARWGEVMRELYAGRQQVISTSNFW